MSTSSEQNKKSKKTRRELKEEYKCLVSRQEILRETRIQLCKRRDALQESLMSALEDQEGNKDKIATLREQIKIIRETIDAVAKEHNENSEVIERYSKKSKNDDEGLAAILNGLGTVVGGVTGYLSLRLAKDTMGLMHETDTSGLLTNKRTMDFWLNKLNPFKWLGKK